MHEVTAAEKGLEYYYHVHARSDSLSGILIEYCCNLIECGAAIRCSRLAAPFVSSGLDLYLKARLKLITLSLSEQSFVCLFFFLYKRSPENRAKGRYIVPDLAQSP